MVGLAGVELWDLRDEFAQAAEISFPLCHGWRRGRLCGRMTKEQQRQALDAAREAGIDLDLLDLNLSLSVAERWRQHDEALALAEQLRAARKKGHDDVVQPVAGANR